MEPTPPPENTIEWIVGTLIGLVATIGVILKGIASRSKPDDKEMEAFRVQIKEDLSAMKTSLKEAIDHADREHEGLRLKVGELTTGLAVMKVEIAHLRNGKK